MKTWNRISMMAAVAVMLASAPATSAFSRTVKQKKQAARTQFENAERMREALVGKPEAHRTRADYQKVVDAYRKVYYTAPTSNKADAAVLAVAELLDDQGRVLNDTKSYKDAIGQLAFLRREYPGSKYRVEALFTIAEIFRDDLNDNKQARATFEDFLKHYPHSALAAKATSALKEITDAENPFKKKSAKAKAEASENQPKAAWAGVTHSAPEPRTSDEKPSSGKGAAPSEATGKPERESRAAQDDQAVAATKQKKDPRSNEPPAADATTSPTPLDVALARLDAQQSHRPARLTSVRHWSTPDYTRVAIDLEQEVEYQSGRVPHPDRIFFDLHGTRLASDLVGKSFDVEAGFLHRIRVAQYKNDVARVVLDVDEVAEYSAFLLPNPYRLIIDIHGKLPATKTASAKPDVNATPAKNKEVEPVSDVTVTQMKPPANSRATEATTTSTIDKSKPAVAVSRPVDSPAKSKAATDKPAEVAKVEQPKILPEDAAIDSNSDSSPKMSGKPTSRPTFEAIAPMESSRNRRPTKETAKPAVATHAAAPTASGDRSLIRALGLKIGKIVVDAGHGGHDTGTIGPNGLMEKDLVLDVALKLGKMLESKLGAEVVYTRDDDTFIPLETRTAIANKEQADMFISIHANSSSDASARGVETYYLNFTSSHDALEVAARENAVSEKSIHELQDLVKKIALKEKIEESREFAADVQRSLYTGLNSRNPGIRNRGVKKAPFIVLIGANMPSILAEISFVSNPGDERKMKTSDYRQRIAESLYKGVNKYVSGLSGVKTASRLEDRNGTKGAAAVALK